MADWQDVRGRGFADRAPLAAAWAWIDEVAPIAGSELAPPAVGRVLAADVIAGADLPPGDRAAIDGYAVASAETEGAGAYNPLPLPRAGATVAGAPMPADADAVLGFASVSQALAALEPVAPGEGVLAQGMVLRAGAVALPAGHRLRGHDLALLAMLGVAEVALRRRPRVRLAIAGPKHGEAEALAPMLGALVARDEGIAERAPLTAPGEPDAILVAGRSGAGADDDAAPALISAGGTMALHGTALRPGGSAGLGRLGAVPVVLLPGEPLGCWVAYEMLAARLVHQLAGPSPSFPRKREPGAAGAVPHPWVPAFAGTTRGDGVVSLKLGRKIVSAIGLLDVVPVAVVGETAVPVAPGLPAACRADGFVVVPETLEGFAEGEVVDVCLYGPA